jgi:hypothetical protein
MNKHLLSILGALALFSSLVLYPLSASAESPIQRANGEPQSYVTPLLGDYWLVAQYEGDADNFCRTDPDGTVWFHIASTDATFLIVNATTGHVEYRGTGQFSCEQNSIPVPGGSWWDGAHCNLRIIGLFDDPATKEKAKFHLTTVLKDWTIWQATFDFAPLGWDNLHLKNVPIAH